MTVAARDLTSSMIRFCRLLRAEGVSVTPSESTDAMRALDCLDLGDRDEVYWGLRTVLTSPSSIDSSSSSGAWRQSLITRREECPSRPRRRKRTPTRLS
jgi:hypothetical protein